MRYRRLDEAGDMIFGGGQADMLRDSPAAVGQAALTRLRLWRGEWFVDTSEGTPWQTAALGMGKRKTIEPAVRARILGTEGVTGIESLELDINPDTRVAVISAAINTVYGQTEIKGIL